MTALTNLGTARGSERPLERLVAFVDESYESGEALRWAGRLAGATAAEVAVVESWQPGYGEFADSVQGAAHARHRAELITWTHEVLSTPLRPSGFDVLIGESPSSLERYLGEAAGQLVVIGVDPPAGARRRNRPVPLRRLVHELRHPLAIVPVAGATREFRRVVVGVDGSDTSLAACAWAALVASLLGAEVHLVTVFEPFVEWVPKEAHGSVWRWVDQQVERHWMAPFRTSRVPVRRHLVEHVHPAEAIGALALELHADAVVVGASGQAGRFQLHRGVTALHVAHDTGLATVMVPEHRL